MLISEKLILVELHKAGSARLKKVLGDLLGGESGGKQGQYANQLLELGKPIVGYVCSPLTWYLAQWRQGCAGKGDIYRRLTNDAKWSQLKARQASRTAKDSTKPNPKAVPDEWNAEYAKTDWYASEDNELAFREWLQAVLGVPGLRKLLDHSYGASPMGRLGGPMTYNFFLSFVRDAENMDKSVDTMEALKAAHESGKITSHFIRAESIAADARRTLEALGVKLDETQRQSIEVLKVRTSADEAAILRFYDPPSLRLVDKREAFILELFGYTLPTPADRAALRAANKKAGKPQGEGEGKPAGGGKGAGKANKAAKQRQRAERAGEAPGGNAAKPGKDAKAAKAAKAGKLGGANAKAKPEKPGKARAATPQAAGEAPAKPQKLKRVKNRPAGADVVDADE